MRISNIIVNGLFGRFDHEIGFNLDERVAIVIGPNGFGKTAMLRIVDAIFNARLRRIEGLPFEQVKVAFDDDSTLIVRRSLMESGPGSRRKRYQVKLSYTANGHTEHFEPQFLGEDDLTTQIRAYPVEDYIPGISRSGPGQWVVRRTGRRIDADDVIAEFGNYLPSQFLPEFECADWLEDLGDEIPVQFIDVDRLAGTDRIEDRTEDRRGTRSHGRLDPFMPRRTISRYSEDLARKVEHDLTVYAALSQSLDRSFPVRLVQGTTDSTLSGDHLIRKFAEVEQKRSSVLEAGFMGQDEISGLTPDDIDKVDEPQRSVLAVYAQDVLQKLSVFDNLCARVNTFKRIANSRLLYKQISVSTKGLEVSTPDGSDIDLEMLSSGEQHQLVLLYDLLFGIEEGALILIDEPELSLHVAWQRALLGDLQEMASLSDFSVLLATHSPQIIGDRWDLAIELKGPRIQ